MAGKVSKLFAGNESFIRDFNIFLGPEYDVFEDGIRITTPMDILSKSQKGK